MRQTSLPILLPLLLAGAVAYAQRRPPGSAVDYVKRGNARDDKGDADGPSLITRKP